MYEGPSFSQEYCNSIRRKKVRRKRTWRVVCATIMAVCISGMSLALSDTVMAAPEEMVSGNNAQETQINEGKQEIQLQETEIWSEETVSGNDVALEVVEKEPGVPTVIIDAGHGGADNGCSRNGILEKDINLAIAKRVQGKLEDMGYQVIMIREEDTYVAKEDRVKYANECQADIYVSIHQNASEDVNAS